MRHNTAPPAVLILLFLIVGVTYSLVTPIFEASDELWHYPVVKYIADGKGLPVQDPAVEAPRQRFAAWWQQEGSQPPAYYALAALATSWIDTGDMAQVRRLNPMANVGNPLAAGNKNMVIHTEHEAFPWHDTSLAVHLIRFLSLLLAAIAVFFTYRLALEVAPGHSGLALTAAALVAFNPMFLFIAGSVNNDNLVVPLATVVLWLLARALREGQISDRRVVLLGILLGLTALTKLSGLALLPAAAGVLLAIAARQRTWAALIRWGLILGALVLGIAGWWYFRNWQLYGDPTGLNVMLDVAGRRPEPFTFEQMRREFQGFWLSYWGVFGGFDIVAPTWVYRLYSLLTVAGLAGWGAWLVRLRAASRRRDNWLRPALGRLLLLTAWTLVVLVALIRWTSQTYASQGRLVFPAIAAIAILIIFGLAGWLPQRWQGRGAAILAGLLLVAAAAMPFAVIRPAYAAPPILTAADVPPDAQHSDVTYENVLRMLAYALPDQTVRPGEMLPITVYWQLVAPTERDLAVFVHLLGQRQAVIGELGTYPGSGAYPLDLLKPGDVVKDTYYVAIAAAAAVPSLIRVDVGLFNRDDTQQTQLKTINSSGTPQNGILGVVRLLPAQPPSYAIPRQAGLNLNGQASLVGYDYPASGVQPGETLTVTLFWQAQKRMAEDYQVLLHLIGPDGKLLAQGDKTPLDGDWPTWAWEPGQTVRDIYQVPIPADLAKGAYQLRTGLYRLADLSRVPVSGPADNVADSAIIIGWVQVR